MQWLSIQLTPKWSQRCFWAERRILEAKKEWINELNVFPVPDGDTGTNMTLTIMSAAREVGGMEQIEMESLPRPFPADPCVVRGAIPVSFSLSCFVDLRRGLRNIRSWMRCSSPRPWRRAVETAYKAVMKPKEGTILTVARGAADKACELAESADDLEMFFRGHHRVCG